MNVATAADICPRCGGGFACGVSGPGPCDCYSLTLSPALLAQLRRDYTQCLCLNCLRELVQADDAAQKDTA